MNILKKVFPLFLCLFGTCLLLNQCQGQQDCRGCYEGNPEYTQRINWAKKTARQEAFRIALKNARRKVQNTIDSLELALISLKQDKDWEIGLLENKLAKVEAASQAVTRSEAKAITGFEVKKNLANLFHHATKLAWRLEFKGKMYDALVVDTWKHRLELFNQYGGGRKRHTFQTIKRQLKGENAQLAFAMNAGMYLPDRSPQGLFISKGKRLRDWDLHPRGSREGNFYSFPHSPGFQFGHGIFALSPRGDALIAPTDQVRNMDLGQLSLATQSGPVMLYQGRINQYFRQGSDNLHIRNGVGLINAHKVVFLISREAVNFYEFSEVFRDVFQCEDALYLDGAISQHYLPELGVANLRAGDHLGPIITVIK